MDRCFLSKPKFWQSTNYINKITSNLHADKIIAEKLEGLYDLYIHTQHKGIQWAITNGDEAFKSFSDMLSYVTNGSIKKLEDLRYLNKDMLLSLENKVNAIIETQIRAMNDPVATVKEATQSKTLISFVKKYNRIAKVRQGVQKVIAPQAMFNVLAKAVAKLPPQFRMLFGGSFDTAIREFEPIRNMYVKQQRLLTYLQDTKNDIFNRLDKAINDAHTILKDFVNWTKDDLNVAIKYFDGNYDKGIEGFRDFLKANNLQILNEEESLTEIYKAVKSYLMAFKEINYGKSLVNVDLKKMKPEDIEKQADDNSVIGYIRNVKKLITELKDVYRIDMPEIEKSFFQVIDEFKPLADYIPRKGVELIDDINIDSSLSYLQSFLKHRKMNTDTATAPMHKIIHANLDNFAVSMNSLANLILFYHGKKALADNADLFVKDNFKYLYLDTFLENVGSGLFTEDDNVFLDIMPYIRKKKNKDIPKHVRVLKNFMNVVTVMPALFIGKLSSVINNVVGGGLGLVSSDLDNISLISSTKLLHDIEKLPDTHVAKKALNHINKLFSTEFSSPGIVSEFSKRINDIEQNKKIDWKNLDEKFKEYSFKVVDFFMDGGFLGKVLPFYSKYLSMKGSETNILRKQIIKVALLKSLYDINTIKDITDDQIKHITEKNLENAFYAIEDLGIFDKNNMPFHEKLMLENADTTAKVLLGGALKLAFTFKHVGRVTLNAFMKNAINFIHKLDFVNPANIIDPVKMMEQFAGVSMVMGIALYNIIEDYFDDDKELPSVSLFQRSDFLSGYGRGWIDIFLGSLAPALNLPVSDKAYETIKRNHIMLIDGIIGGRDIASGWVANKMRGWQADSREPLRQIYGDSFWDMISVMFSGDTYKQLFDFFMGDKYDKFNKEYWNNLLRLKYSPIGQFKEFIPTFRALEYIGTVMTTKGNLRNEQVARIIGNILGLSFYYDKHKNNKEYYHYYGKIAENQMYINNAQDILEHIVLDKDMRFLTLDPEGKEYYKYYSYRKYRNIYPYQSLYLRDYQYRLSRWYVTHEKVKERIQELLRPNFPKNYNYPTR